MYKFDYELEINKIWQELSYKRDLGLKKYGIDSYQHSIENLNKVDLCKHAEDELADIINYSLTQILKLRILKTKLLSYD